MKLSTKIIYFSFSILLFAGCHKAEPTAGQLFDAVMTKDNTLNAVKTNTGVNMQQVGNRSNYTQYSGFNAPQTVFVDMVVDKGKPVQISTDVSGDAFKNDLDKIIRTSFIDTFNLNNEDAAKLKSFIANGINDTDAIELWKFTANHTPNSVKIVATDMRYAIALGDDSKPSRKLMGLPTTVSIGMKSADVSDILGDPKHKDTITTSTGTNEVWTYSDGTAITFNDGAVTVIQQSN